MNTQFHRVSNSLKIISVGVLLLIGTSTYAFRANISFWKNSVSAGILSLFAGSVDGAGYLDDTGSAAKFISPQSVALDGGNIYVADQGTNTIRKITAAGVVTTLAGTPGVSGAVDGTGASAQFSGPMGVAVNSGSGEIFVADTYNHTIRKVTPAGVVTTFAGAVPYQDGTGGGARFFHPWSTAVDSSGNVFVADADNHTIRKVTSAGVVTTLAGKSGKAGFTDGTGSAASFSGPNGVAVDGSGNVYVADTSNQTIRKVTPAGLVTTLAGTAGRFGSTDGTGSVALFHSPNAVAVGSSGSLYVADADNNTIRKVTSGGSVTTVAGAPPGSDGTGGASRFNTPAAAAMDSSGNVYVADSYNYTIRKITSAGVVTTLAGAAGLSGIGDGTGSEARFQDPRGLGLDSSGNIYVADRNTIRKITPGGVVTTLAGTGSYGSTDGPGATASFDNLRGLAVDAGGNIYVAEMYNGTIRKITSGGVVTTFAGTAGSLGSADGIGNAASFSYPMGVAVDASGNVFVSDAGNNTIRMITSAQVVTTIAGNVGVSGNADGTGSAARFSGPTGLALDSSGNIYVADSYNHSIRKVTSAGVVTTPVGGTLGSLDGTGNAARFNSPNGVAFDSSGILYVADTANNMIRKVTTATGVVTTFAGSAPGMDGTGAQASFNHPSGLAFDVSGYLYVTDASNASIRKIDLGTGVVTTLAGGVSAGSSDGSGGAASFSNPQGMTIDSSGNLFVADTYNGTIRKVTSAGVVTTLAGTAGITGYADGAGGAAKFTFPTGLSVDSSGNLFVADAYNDTIRKITSAGVVTTLAGAAPGTDGVGAAASFKYPLGLAFDSAGNLYVTDSNQIIRKITSAGVVTTLAGLAGVSGSSDGTGSAARFNFPAGLAVDSADNIYVADRYNQSIRKVTAAGVVTTLAGGMYGSADGTGAGASFATPHGLAVDSSGNVYVGDSFNYTIRKVTAGGVVTTMAGTAGIYGSTDATGAAASFSYPSGLAVDSSGNIYVADSSNNTIRKITSVAVVTTLVGTPAAVGSTDATGAAASFFYPTGLAADSSGNIYVADTNNNTIRKITSLGVVTTLAGTPGVYGSSDGTGAAASFSYPSGLAVDSSDNVYVTDGSNTIRKITPAGVVTTLAGMAGVSGSSDGTGSAAKFYGPKGIALDSAGNIYVADTNNNMIRKITSLGVVTTLAGTPGVYGSSDGTGGAARFSYPSGLAVDSSDNVYVADSYNNLIRKVTPAGVVTTLAGAALVSGSADGTGGAARFSYPSGLAVDSSDNVYVTDGSNTIRKVTPAGVVTTVVGVAPMASVKLGPLPGFIYYPAAVGISGGQLFIAVLNGVLKCPLP